LYEVSLNSNHKFSSYALDDELLGTRGKNASMSQEGVMVSVTLV
jgi:hypothetical protein